MAKMRPRAIFKEIFGAFAIFFANLEAPKTILEALGTLLGASWRDLGRLLGGFWRHMQAIWELSWSLESVVQATR